MDVSAPTLRLGLRSRLCCCSSYTRLTHPPGPTYSLSDEESIISFSLSHTVLLASVDLLLLLLLELISTAL